MKPTRRPNGEAASANITQRIQELGDWRGETAVAANSSVRAQRSAKEKSGPCSQMNVSA